MKIHLVGDKPFHAARLTDTKTDSRQKDRKAKSCFHNFANAPKNHTQGNKNQ